MVKLDARKSGSFQIGGDIEIHRLGFGAMRVTGPRVWGPPLNKDEAVRTLKRLPELGIDFVDTADSYGPDVSEQLIRRPPRSLIWRKMLLPPISRCQMPSSMPWTEQECGRPAVLVGLLVDVRKGAGTGNRAALPECSRSANSGRSVSARNVVRTSPSAISRKSVRAFQFCSHKPGSP